MRCPVARAALSRRRLPFASGPARSSSDRGCWHLPLESGTRRKVPANAVSLRSSAGAGEALTRAMQIRTPSHPAALVSADLTGPTPRAALRPQCMQQELRGETFARRPMRRSSPRLDHAVRELKLTGPCSRFDQSSRASETHSSGSRDLSFPDQPAIDAEEIDERENSVLDHQSVFLGEVTDQHPSHGRERQDHEGPIP